jgi:hypothetical protein
MAPFGKKSLCTEECVQPDEILLLKGVRQEGGS